MSEREQVIHFVNTLNQITLEYCTDIPILHAAANLRSLIIQAWKHRQETGNKLQILINEVDLTPSEFTLACQPNKLDKVVHSVQERLQINEPEAKQFIHAQMIAHNFEYNSQTHNYLPPEICLAI